MQPQVQCVFGPRGSGKSTLARELVADAQKVLAFDPQRDYVGGRWINAATRDDVQTAIIDAIGGPLRVSYTPDLKRCDPVTEGAWLAWAADIAQSSFPAHDPRPLTLLYDEAHIAFPVEKGRSADCAAIRAAVLQGRHQGIGLTFVTQRPANLATDARSQAAEVYCFKMMQANDRKVIADMHPGAARALDDLGDFEFLRITGKGIDVCKLNFRGGDTFLTRVK